jgi:hypothetical protein
LRYTLIDTQSAPAKPGGPMNKRAAMVQSIVSDLVPGKVAKVELEGTETTRGTKASISRAAKKLGRTVAVWDNQGVVYAELSEGRARRRGRPRGSRESRSE